MLYLDYMIQIYKILCQIWYKKGQVPTLDGIFVQELNSTVNS